MSLILHKLAVLGLDDLLLLNSMNEKVIDMSHKTKFAKMLALSAAPAIIHNSVYENTLTRLIPDLYAGLDVISRELVGFIPSVARNSTAERAAVGESVVWPVAPSQTAIDIAPAMTTPEPRDQTIGNKTMTITKARAVEFGFTGEEQVGLNNGPGYLTVQADMFAQGLRTLVNEIETDLAVEATANASRATGTAGTTPYASDIGAAAQLRKILDDNGAPQSDRSQVINTSTGAKLRTLFQLTKANEAGTAMTLRQGELLDLSGFSVKESAQAVTHTSSGATGVATDNAGYAVGATVITVTGAAAVVPGDIVSFAGDTNKYVVASATATELTLAEPGLRVAIPAAATAATIGITYEANVGFSRNAMQLAMRAPALPQEGDSAIDRMSITDPRSGMTFEISLYAGYRKIRAEVAAAWGVKATKSEHIALLLG